MAGWKKNNFAALFILVKASVLNNLRTFLKSKHLYTTDIIGIVVYFVWGGLFYFKIW